MEMKTILALHKQNTRKQMHTFLQFQENGADSYTVLPYKTEPYPEFDIGAHFHTTNREQTRLLTLTNREQKQLALSDIETFSQHFDLTGRN